MHIIHTYVYVIHILLCSQLLDKTIGLGAGPELSKEKAEKASRVMDSQMDDEEVEEVTGVFLGSGMGDVFGLEKEEELAAMNAPPPQVEYVVNVVSVSVGCLVASHPTPCPVLLNISPHPLSSLAQHLTHPLSSLAQHLM